MWRKRVFGVIALALMGLAAMTGTAHAANGDKGGTTTGTDASVSTSFTGGDKPTLAKVADQVEQSRIAINLVWLMVGGVLVLFMQAGFALVETGFTQAKNASHTM